MIRPTLTDIDDLSALFQSSGGIGFELVGSLRIMDYQQVSAILLWILVCVAVVNGIGGWLRKRLV